ncbi:MAG: DUF502 domain-containing protein [Symbiobacteriia bacterium]
MKRLQTFFVAGLIAITPAAVTYLVLRWLFTTVDGSFGGPIEDYISGHFGVHLPGVGLVGTVLIILLVGILVTNLVGREALKYMEGWLEGVPLVRSVYSTLRQITDAFWKPDQNTFKRVVLVEYPRRGCWAIGFITAEVRASGLGITASGDIVYNVFVPTTPNPTSGFLMIYPSEEVRMLDVSVEDGMKLVISGGVLVPASLLPVAEAAEQPTGS